MIYATTRLIIFSVFILLSTAHSTLAFEYKLSMLPRYSTEEINLRIVPLADYLSKKTGLTIVPIHTSTFDQYLKQLVSGGVAIGFENPYIYVLASQEHEVVAMAEKGKDGDKFRGIIITRSDSKLRDTEDVIGKKICIVGYTSAGGYLSQKLSLLESGIDVEKDCIIEEAQENKQENVIFSVFTGDVDAGFIRESALHRADDYVPPSSIRVLGSSAWLPNWALSLSRSMPLADKQKIIAALADLGSDSPVLKALKIKALRPAKDEEYDPVRKAAGMK